MPGQEEASAPGHWHVPLPGVALGGHGGERAVPPLHTQGGEGPCFVT